MIITSIVDRVQVTLITNKSIVDEKIKIAREKYKSCDLRLKGLTDESVDTFYSCILCQSFALTMFALSLQNVLVYVGAVSWLDAKALNEITPTGPNQPIAKGAAIDELSGMWQNVNEYLYAASN